MTNETRISAGMTIAVIAIISAFQRSNDNMFDVSVGMGIPCFSLGILAAIIGLIVSIIPKIKSYGQGMLIGGGILILIEFSISSGGFGLVK